MQHTATTFAQVLADQMIAERFGRAYGITTFEAYLDRLDTVTTAHLAKSMTERIKATAGAQRRAAKLSIENASTVIIGIPMTNPRARGAFVWAKLELSQWLDLMEIGAYGTWFLAHKSKDRSDAQVRTKVPLSGQTTTTNATIARVIANAKPGQQARTLDRNPLNLRRANIFVIGKVAQGERPAGRAKTDTRAQLQERKAIAQSLRGRGYGPNLDGQQ